MAYKVFTNGSVLQASEINENLMRQSIAVFSNAAARTAAITSPVAGQMTYLEDSDRYFEWNGTSWLSPFGETFIKSVSFTSASSVNFGTNSFIPEFNNYKIVITLAMSSGSPISIRLISGGAVDSTANYTTIGSGLNSAGTTGNNTFARVSQTDGWIYQGISGENAGAILNLYNPLLSTSRTTWTGEALGATLDNANLAHWNFGGKFNTNKAFDDIQFQPGAGNFGGTISLYGLRK